jgi:hypothetical protein
MGTSFRSSALTCIGLAAATLLTAVGIGGTLPRALAAAGSVQISSDLPLRSGFLTVSGTVTCEIPSGTATIQVTASEIVWIPTHNPSYSVASGATSVSVNCAATPVAWSAAVRSSSSQPFAPGFFTNVGVTVVQPGAANLTAGTYGYPHYA